MIRLAGKSARPAARAVALPIQPGIAHRMDRCSWFVGRPLVLGTPAEEGELLRPIERMPAFDGVDGVVTSRPGQVAIAPRRSRTASRRPSPAMQPSAAPRAPSGSRRWDLRPAPSRRSTDSAPAIHPPPGRDGPGPPDGAARLAPAVGRSPFRRGRHPAGVRRPGGGTGQQRGVRLAPGRLLLEGDLCHGADFTKDASSSARSMPAKDHTTENTENTEHTENF